MKTRGKALAKVAPVCADAVTPEPIAFTRGWKRRPPGAPRPQLSTDATKQPGDSQTARLLKANKRLELAASRAETEAATCALALEAATRAAEIDTLTGLPNRGVLLERFAHATGGATHDGVRMALLFLDLDDFKQVNDLLGHACGDEVLKRVARCLSASVREADVVSRYGGDEFLILLTGVSRPSDAVRVARKVIATLGASTRIADPALRLTASIGISIYPDDGEDIETLIDRADTAMYRAKKRGPGSFVIHGDETPIVRGLTSPARQSMRHVAPCSMRTQVEEDGADPKPAVPPGAKTKAAGLRVALERGTGSRKQS